MYDTLRAAIVSVWTDVPANGVYESEGLDMTPWEDLDPPYAVIVASKGDPSEEFNTTQFAWTFAVELLYVGAVPAGNLSNIRTALDNMLEFLVNGGLHGLARGVPGIDWGNEIDANRVFVEKNYTHRAGRIQLTFLNGYTRLA